MNNSKVEAGVSAFSRMFFESVPAFLRRMQQGNDLITELFLGIVSLCCIFLTLAKSDEGFIHGFISNGGHVLLPKGNPCECSLLCGGSIANFLVGSSSIRHPVAIDTTKCHGKQKLGPYTNVLWV